MMKRKLKVRYVVLGALLLLVWVTQWIPALGNIYSQTIYPVISYVLSFFSNLVPFAVGDLFIFLSIAGIIVYPIYGRIRGRSYCCTMWNICYGYMYGSIWLGGSTILKATFINEAGFPTRHIHRRIFKRS